MSDARLFALRSLLNKPLRDAIFRVIKNVHAFMNIQNTNFLDVTTLLYVGLKFSFIVPARLNKLKTSVKLQIEQIKHVEP